MAMFEWSTVAAIFKQVAQEQERTFAPLTDDLKLLESGLVSSSFSINVAKLEDELGFDPFNADEMVEFSITFADSARRSESLHTEPI
jgi:hypothetical protein